VLRPGDAVELALPFPVAASAVAAVSALGESLQIAQDTPVLRIDLIGADGSGETVWWRAGVHTAEWAWDRPDVRSVVPHVKARVAETLPGGGNRYFAVANVAHPLQVVRVRVAYTAPTGALDLARISLHDAATGHSHPLGILHRLLADGQRWQPRLRSGSVVVLENLHALPRAWLVPATRRLDAAGVRKALDTGTLADGTRFDPAALALVEDEPARDFGTADPEGQVEVVEYAPTRLALHARARTPSFLVLSEIFVPGWRAEVDGVATPIRRTDYVLRGLELAAGEHRIELVYAPGSVWLGAAISVFALAAFAAAGIWRLRTARTEKR
jgi:hypothetical protein